MVQSALLPSLFKIIAGLAVVLALIYLISLLLKRFPRLGRYLGTSVNGNATLKLKERLALGRRTSLMVVEWKNQEYLLAVSGDQVHSISRYEGCSEIKHSESEQGPPQENLSKVKQHQSAFKKTPNASNSPKVIS